MEEKNPSTNEEDMKCLINDSPMVDSFSESSISLEIETSKRLNQGISQIPCQAKYDTVFLLIEPLASEFNTKFDRQNTEIEKRLTYLNSKESHISDEHRHNFVEQTALLFYRLCKLSLSTFTLLSETAVQVKQKLLGQEQTINAELKHIFQLESKSLNSDFPNLFTVYQYSSLLIKWKKILELVQAKDISVEIKLKENEITQDLKKIKELAPKNCENFKLIEIFLNSTGVNPATYLSVLNVNQEEAKTSARITLDKCLYFVIIFKLLHTSNVYLVQPNLNIYLTMFGINGFETGYIIAIMNFSKLAFGLVYSQWSISSYKKPLCFACIVMIIANIIYVFSSNFESKAVFYGIVVMSRILVGVGSAKVALRRLTIDFSSPTEIFLFSCGLMMVDNLGHAVGPLVNLISLTDDGDLSYYELVIPSFIFSLIWMLALLYLIFGFAEPYEVIASHNSLQDSSINEIMLFKNSKSTGDNTILSAGEALRKSLNPELLVLVLIFFTMKAIIEFQLWSIPIFVQDLFYQSVTFTILYTSLVMFIRKLLFNKKSHSICCLGL